MANRRLTESELSKARELIVDVSARLIELAQGDQELLFAFRRKVWKELYYGERGKPMARRALKAKKRSEQVGICPLCANPLPQTYAVLDRLDAMLGYTVANTRLICQDCDTRAQRGRGYA